MKYDERVVMFQKLVISARKLSTSLPNVLKYKTSRRLFHAVRIIVTYGCLSHLTFVYIAELVVCNGPSMEPTIHSNDVLLAEHVSIRLQKFNRGDVIVSKNPSDKKQFICKRLVGIPGDKISVGFFTRTVPSGHLWLEGDNRNNSTDSRNYGPIPQDLVQARVLCKLWPYFCWF